MRRFVIQLETDGYGASSAPTLSMRMAMRRFM